MFWISLILTFIFSYNLWLETSILHNDLFFLLNFIGWAGGLIMLVELYFEK